MEEKHWPGYIVAGIIALGAVVLLCGRSHAHDHEHPELNDWYMGLHSKGGAWCCDGDDASTVEEWKSDNGHYSVKIEDAWVDVPADAIVEGPNRAGVPKVWIGHLNGNPWVRCFIPGTMS